jgi:Rhodopirellula transposase DDE domain
MTPTTVARCLHDLGYSLQANVKTIEGRQHPDRDAQFRYINARVRLFQRTGDPVVSVDTKKKELIGVPSV